MNMYSGLMAAYRTVLPAGVRTAVWRNRLTRGPREWLLRRAERLATHDEIYSRAYFETAVDPAAAAAAPVMAAALHAAVGPRSVVDVGCGTGQLLLAFARLGVAGRGLEYSEAALAICRDRRLDVAKYDLEDARPVGGPPADLVTSTEVAEHLPVSVADAYVDLLCRLAPAVFLTAAPPGQGGTDHVNEQPNGYWIAKLAARGFDYDAAASDRFRADWPAAGVPSYYACSAMLFRRR